MSRKFFISTFGCRTNQADSDALRDSFKSRSFVETDSGGEADVIVVNSCTVTHRSDQQVRQMTRRLLRDNPEAKVIVTGCYAQRDPAALSKIPGVAAVVGNSRKHELVELAAAEVAAAPTENELADLYLDDFRKTRSMKLTPSVEIGGKTRPFVKIQDGCDAKCTYCIIPSVRGPSRSAPVDQILSHVDRLVRMGFREIVLTGIHIGTYGTYLKPRCPLDELLKRILDIPGLGQVRISSIEPMALSERVIELAAEEPRIAPHFHICLQSGSDSVLKRMLRPYRTARFASIVEQIRRRLPHAAIGTDLIVGFPGETAAEHRETVRFVRRMPFTYLHVFPYSDRSGTVASEMNGKVGTRTIGKRAAQLRAISEEKNRRFRESFVGQTLRFLTLTEVRDGYRSGISGNYLMVRTDPRIPANQLEEGRVTEADEKFLKVSVVRSSQNAGRLQSSALPGFDSKSTTETA